MNGLLQWLAAVAAFAALWFVFYAVAVLVGFVDPTQSAWHSMLAAVSVEVFRKGMRK